MGRLSRMVLVTILSLTACTSQDPGPEDSSPQSTVRAEAESFQAQGEAVAMAIGVPLLPDSMGTFDVHHCEDSSRHQVPDAFALFASFELRVGEDQRTKAAEDALAYWTSIGLKADPLKDTPRGGKFVVARDLTRRDVYIRDTVGDVDELSLTISGGCRRDPTGAPAFGPYQLTP